MTEDLPLAVSGVQHSDPYHVGFFYSFQPERWVGLKRFEHLDVFNGMEFKSFAHLCALVCGAEQKGRWFNVGFFVLFGVDMEKNMESRFQATNWKADVKHLNRSGSKSW